MDDDTEALARHLESCGRCVGTASMLHGPDTLVELARAQNVAEIAAENEPIQALIERLSAMFSAFEDAAEAIGAKATSEDNPTSADVHGILKSPQAADEVGRLGPYRILKLLGAGGMGVVFKAEDPTLQRIVALKTLQPAIADCPAARARFLHEARAVAALEDERIVAIHHVGEDTGIPYFVMPLLRGQTLADRLREARRATGSSILPLDEALRIGCEAARGLASAHASGLIHRDIKPGNIFLKEEGTVVPNVKLLDFGLARGLDDEMTLQLGVVAGTPGYVAPEQSAGGPIDERSDLFGLGCVLYHMTTGRTPWRGKRAGTSSAAEGRMPPHAINPEVPEELSDFILQLVAVDPASRPPSASMVAERLSAIRERLLSASPAQPRKTGRKWSVGVAASVVMIVALAATILVRTDRGDETKVTVPLRLATIDAFDAWVAQVPALPALQQVEAVSDKLKALNPGFDGHVGSRLEGDKVVEVHILTDHITDVSPLRALVQLEMLVCRGSESGKGLLADLSPLESLKNLHYLDFSANRVSDLSPLGGLPLRALSCWANPIQDIRPLDGVPLRNLHLSHTFVTDADLWSIVHLPVQSLHIKGTYATELRALAGLPLREIECDFRPNRHPLTLRNLKGLQTINGTPVVQFWRAHDARRLGLKSWVKRVAVIPAEDQVAEVTDKLQELNPGFNEELSVTIEDGAVVALQVFVNDVTDIAPLRAFTKLKRLTICGATPKRGRVYDLDPLRELPLEYLDCSRTEVAELSSLEGMKLRELRCADTFVRDLTPLERLPLVLLDCGSSRVGDLTPLKGTGITHLYLKGCPLTDLSRLTSMSIDLLEADLDPARDASVLRGIKTLESINGRPAAEFGRSFTHH